LKENVMKKVISEVALTVVSTFATLLFMAMLLAYFALFAGLIGVIAPLVAWVEGDIDTTTLLIYAIIYGSLLALGKHYEDLPFIDVFEKAWKRGFDISLPLLVGGLIVAGIITNFF